MLLARDTHQHQKAQVINDKNHCNLVVTGKTGVEEYGLDTDVRPAGTAMGNINS